MMIVESLSELFQEAVWKLNYKGKMINQLNVKYYSYKLASLETKKRLKFSIFVVLYKTIFTIYY